MTERHERIFWQIANRVGVICGLLTLGFGAADRAPWRIILGALSVAMLVEVSIPALRETLTIEVDFTGGKPEDDKVERPH